MSTILVGLENLLEVLWRISWQASVLAVLLMVVASLVRLPARVRCVLWMLVLLRLVLPVLPESRWSVFNLMGMGEHGAMTGAVPVNKVSENNAVPGFLASGAAEIEVHLARAAGEKQDGRANWATAAVSAAAGSGGAWSGWQMLALGWSAGAAVMLAGTLIASMRLRRMLKEFRPLEDAKLEALLANCAAELAVTRRMGLYTSGSLNSPALVGLWRPRLVLPEGLPGELSAQELRLVFLHELTHYKRWDIPLNYLLAILQAAHWFNPVLHVFFSRVRADRELACDEVVMARLEDPRCYGQTILKLLQALAGPRRATMPGVVGILESKSLMKRRMAMIASFRPRSRWMALGCVVLLAGVGCVGMTDAVSRGESSDMKPAAKQAEVSVEPEARLKVGDAPEFEAQMLVLQADLNAQQNAYADRAKQLSAMVDQIDPAKNAAEAAKMKQDLDTVHRMMAETEKRLADASQQVNLAAGVRVTQAAEARPAAAKSGAIHTTRSVVVDLPEGATLAVDKPIETALNGVMAMTMDATPLQQVLDLFADKLDVNMVVDWPALGTAGVEKTTPITLRITKPVPARKLLELALHQAGGSLGFKVDSGVLEITTSEAVDSEAIVRVYLVTDLLESKGAIGISPELAAKKAQDLTGLIESTVAPASWFTHGGTIGSINMYNGKLVVKTTPTHQEEVLRVLQMLRDDAETK